MNPPPVSTWAAGTPIIVSGIAYDPSPTPALYTGGKEGAPIIVAHHYEGVGGGTPILIPTKEVHGGNKVGEAHTKGAGVKKGVSVGCEGEGLSVLVECQCVFCSEGDPEEP